jgi:hypothetical protein
MSQDQLLVSIVLLIAVEMLHLKWIWWTQWACRVCKLKNEHCACDRRRWMMYL